jgi:hypothetical protein
MPASGGRETKRPVFVPRHVAHRRLKGFGLVSNLSDKLLIPFGIRLSLLESIAERFQTVQLSTQIRNIKFCHE